MSRKTILVICIAVIVGLAFFGHPARAANNFLTGWWIDVNRPQMLAQFGAEGNTLVNATSAGWFCPQPNVIKTFLDEAQKNNIKVILGMTNGWSTTQQFTDTIKAFKDHPALYGWYIADEPELASDEGAAKFAVLSTNPGYYNLIKQIDSVHPVFISFNMVYDLNTWYNRVRKFYSVTNLIGMHNYPFWDVNPGEFSGEMLEHSMTSGHSCLQKQKLMENLFP